MSVNDYGIEVLKKTAVEVLGSTPKTEYLLRVTGLPGQPVPITFADPTTPNIINITAPGTPDTEFSQAIPDGTKRLCIKARGVGKIKFAFNSGDSGVTYITIPPGSNYEAYGLNLSSIIIYMQTNIASEVIELIAWT